MLAVVWCCLQWGGVKRRWCCLYIDFLTELSKDLLNIIAIGRLAFFLQGNSGLAISVLLRTQLQSPTIFEHVVFKPLL